MDDAELTKLAFEISTDIPELDLALASDVSTEANIDSTDSFILDLVEEYHKELDIKSNDEVEIAYNVSHSPPHTPPLDSKEHEYPAIISSPHYPPLPPIQNPPIPSPFSPLLSPSDSYPMVKSILISPSAHRSSHGHLGVPKVSQVQPVIKHPHQFKRKRHRKPPPIIRKRPPILRHKPRLNKRASLPAIHEHQRRRSLKRRDSLIPDFSISRPIQRSKTLTTRTHTHNKPTRNSDPTSRRKKHRKTQSFGGNAHHHSHGQTLLRSRHFRRRTDVYFKGDKRRDERRQGRHEIGKNKRQRSLTPVPHSRNKKELKIRVRSATDDVLKNKEYAVETSYGFEFAVYSSCDDGDLGDLDELDDSDCATVIYHKSY